MSNGLDCATGEEVEVTDERLGTAAVTSSVSASGAYSFAIEERRRWLRARMRGLEGDTGWVWEVEVREREDTPRVLEGRAAAPAPTPAIPEDTGAGGLSESLWSFTELFSELQELRSLPKKNGLGGDNGAALPEASDERRRVKAAAMGVTVGTGECKFVSSSLESLCPEFELELAEGGEWRARYASADEYAVRPLESFLRYMIGEVLAGCSL